MTQSGEQSEGERQGQPHHVRAKASGAPGPVWASREVVAQGFRRGVVERRRSHAQVPEGELRAHLAGRRPRRLVERHVQGPRPQRLEAVRRARPAPVRRVSPVEHSRERHRPLARRGHRVRRRRPRQPRIDVRGQHATARVLPIGSGPQEGAETSIRQLRALGPLLRQQPCERDDALHLQAELVLQPRRDGHLRSEQAPSAVRASLPVGSSWRPPEGVLMRTRLPVSSFGNGRFGRSTFGSSGS